MLGFFEKFLSQQKTPEQINNALHSIRAALKIPSQKAKDLWNSFTHFFRKNRKNIGIGLTTVGASIGFGLANVNPAIAQNSLEINQPQTHEVSTKPYFEEEFDQRIKFIIQDIDGELVRLGGENGGLAKLASEEFIIDENLTDRQKNQAAVDGGLGLLAKRNTKNWNGDLDSKKPKVREALISRKIVQSKAFEDSYNEYANKEIAYNFESYLEVLSRRAMLAATRDDIFEVVKDAGKKLNDANLTKEEKQKIAKYIINLNNQEKALERLQREYTDLLDEMVQSQGKFFDIRKS